MIFMAPHELLIVMLIAYALDLFIGDPEGMAHPVRWMGALIARLETAARRLARESAAGQRLCGALMAMVTVAVVFLLSWGLLHAAGYFSRVLFLVLAVYMSWTALSARSLHREADAVKRLLVKEGVESARRRLGRIVGRDTDGLSEKQVLRALVETVSENASDGVVAPLFYMAIGGPALALAYKAINTLDSMVGYKNERYMNIGWFSARMDDAANYLPARVTALCMVASSLVLGLDWRGSLRVLKRDSRRHPSPNAGLPEAAAAGALGVRLGGPMSYAGAPCQKPFIGDEVLELEEGSVDSAIKMMHVAGFITLFFAAVFLMYLT